MALLGGPPGWQRPPALSLIPGADETWPAYLSWACSWVLYAMRLLFISAFIVTRNGDMPYAWIPSAR